MSNFPFSLQWNWDDHITKESVECISYKEKVEKMWCGDTGTERGWIVLARVSLLSTKNTASIMHLVLQISATLTANVTYSPCWVPPGGKSLTVWAAGQDQGVRWRWRKGAAPMGSPEAQWSTLTLAPHPPTALTLWQTTRLVSRQSSVWAELWPNLRKRWNIWL